VTRLVVNHSRAGHQSSSPPPKSILRKGLDTLVVAAVSALQPLMTISGVDTSVGQATREGIQRVADIDPRKLCCPLISAVTFVGLSLHSRRSYNLEEKQDYYVNAVEYIDTSCRVCHIVEASKVLPSPESISQAHL
jgi:hypothetical protein